MTKRSKQKDNHNQYHQQINTQQPSPSDSNHATNGNSKPVKCETCVRLETEAKRLKSELNVLKHLEIEMREKNEMNSTIKTCLQAKQKEIDEMHNKYMLLIFSSTKFFLIISYIILESKSSQTYDTWIIKISKLWSDDS